MTTTPRTVADLGPDDIGRRFTVPAYNTHPHPVTYQGSAGAVAHDEADGWFVDSHGARVRLAARAEVHPVAPAWSITENPDGSATITHNGVDVARIAEEEAAAHLTADVVGGLAAGSDESAPFALSLTRRYDVHGITRRYLPPDHPSWSSGFVVDGVTVSASGSERVDVEAPETFPASEIPARLAAAREAQA